MFLFTSSYKKTHETLSHAGQKATAAFSNVGTAISRKFGDMRYCGQEPWELCSALGFLGEGERYLSARLPNMLEVFTGLHFMWLVVMGDWDKFLYLDVCCLKVSLVGLGPMMSFPLGPNWVRIDKQCLLSLVMKEDFKRMQYITEF